MKYIFNKMTPINADKKRCIKLLIEYEGTEFAGWQIQPKMRTVQEEIEKGLYRLTGTKITVTAAGRTDAGVHALEQVVSFQTDSQLSMVAFYKGLNRYLPEDLRVNEAEEKSENFNARRDAVARTYRYIIATKQKIIGRRFCWYPQFNFLLDPIRKASKYLKGEHNYTSFCKKNKEENYDNISTVHTIKWKIQEDDIIFEITAKRFFHNMVRIIVGTLLEVGRGRWTPQDFKNILEARNRKLAGPTAPPQGLFLVKVHYK